MTGYPPMQLFNLKNDPGEQNNLYENHPEKVEELTAALIKIISDGRSTPGENQSNEGMDQWPQLEEIHDH